ncbi:MAG: cupin [Planctomycetota bacterium]|nr:cupin [Planctomycetota bacterium]
MTGQSKLGETVLSCADFDANLNFFTEDLAFELREIFPADNPREALLVAYGLRLRLRRGPEIPAILILYKDTVADGKPERSLAPGGTVIEWRRTRTSFELPALKATFQFAKLAEQSWTVGRAGMLYRDLIPDRQGGRFIASHIKIEEGGPVPDYVHYHDIRFQLIYCYKGWVRLVYEDQGPAFVLRAGDCVLQPPQIRHRVLESSAGLEVIEIGCPAEHKTYPDPILALPTAELDPQRDFHGQRFVLDRGDEGEWGDWRIPGFRSRKSNIAAATGGLAQVAVVRPHGESDGFRHEDCELSFHFVLQGSMRLDREDQSLRIEAGDAFVLPGGEGVAFRDVSEDLEFLEVALPADFSTSTIQRI